MRRVVLLEWVRRIGASDVGARAVRGAAPATADDPIQLSISVAGLLQIVNIVQDMGATGASLGAGVGDWTAGWNAAVDGPAMGRAGSRLAPRVSLWSPAPRRVGGKISPRGRIIRSSGNIATIFWPSPTRLATHTPVMSDFRPHDQESAWEFIGIGAAVFVFAIVALGWRTALRWCGDCALDRRARRERLQEEEALRLTRTLLPTHGDESYGSSSNATVIELVVDGGTPTSAPTHGDTATTTNDEDHPVEDHTGAINGR